MTKKLDTKQTPETPSKITLEDLIKRSTEIKTRQRKTQEIYVESLGGTITVQEPDEEVISIVLRMEEGQQEAYSVYECCISPNLKDQQLRDTYGCVEPYEIASKLFKPMELKKISRLLVELSDSKVHKVDSIKN
jgi:hypothetical protein